MDAKIVLRNPDINRPLTCSKPLREWLTAYLEYTKVRAIAGVVKIKPIEFIELKIPKSSGVKTLPTNN